MAYNISEYLVKLEELTQKNLNILQTINDSFYTQREHLTVNVDDKTTVVIPSFISLENKINSLASDFENLINAPKTGEANFYYDGNSQSIEVKGFSNTPSKLALKKLTTFGINKNDIFKDFLTPEPYISFNLNELSNDITKVNIRKIALKNEDLITQFKPLISNEPTNTIQYSDLAKILINYKEDIDYISYDTVKSLPVKQSLGYGEYVIDEIIDNKTDENFEEYYTLKISSNIDDPNKSVEEKEKLNSSNLTYKLYDETIEKKLELGDELVTYNDKVKLKIININQNNNTIIVKVINGAYVNLTTKNSSNKDLYTLKYFNAKNINTDKYINVSLEEDQYIFVFIAPINDRMLIQAPWGQGLFLDVFNLYYTDGNDTYYFKDYYDMFVNNIGDALYGLTAMIQNNIFDYNYDEYIKFTKVKPFINKDNLLVTEINSHLNNSTAVKNIRNLYSQKQHYKQDLEIVQRDIDNINSQLSSLSFQDTSNTRAIYTAQLSQLNERKQELVNSISSILTEISTNANDSEIPIEDAKYRIRGYFDWENFLKINDLEKLNVIRIAVQYRYKNKDKVTGNALSIGKSDNGTSDFIFSDWNTLYTPLKKLIPTHNKTTYSFVYPENNDNINEPSFNQIDIPISQGESVDIKLKVIYDLGYPYVETTSDWSEIVNIEFPQEYLKNVSILDIITENNDDIKKNQFNGLLDKGGYTKHVEDLVVDQDVTYFHHPEYISSGFYTAERRVIPLKDKLEEINGDIITLKDEVFGTSSDDLTVNILDGNVVTKLLPFADNMHLVTAYQDAAQTGQAAVSQLFIELKNTGDHNVKLFSIFPGNCDTELTSESHGFLPINNYVQGTDMRELAVWMKNIGDKDSKDNPLGQNKQVYNQYLYFRLNNAYDNTMYYELDDPRTKQNKLCGIYKKDIDTEKDNKIFITATGVDNAVLYPMINNKVDLSVSLNNLKYKLLKPGESIQLCLMFKYILTTYKRSIEKTISFDIRTSLYAEPINYVVTIKANYNDTLEDKIAKTSQNNKYNAVIVD